MQPGNTLKEAPPCCIILPETSWWGPSMIPLFFDASSDSPFLCCIQWFPFSLLHPENLGGRPTPCMGPQRCLGAHQDSLGGGKGGNTLHGLAWRCLGAHQDSLGGPPRLTGAPPWKGGKTKSFKFCIKEQDPQQQVSSISSFMDSSSQSSSESVDTLLLAPSKYFNTRHITQT
jgi:hypothetical protein